MILTGMLDDGAQGIKAIHDRGGWTVAQESSTCAVPSMPKAAIALGGVDRVIPLEDIAAELIYRVECRFSPLGLDPVPAGDTKSEVRG